MKQPLLAALAIAILPGFILPAAHATPQSTPAPAPSPGEIVAAAPAAEWQEIAADDLLLMMLANGRSIVIQLNPDFSRTHVANMRALARAHWWDGTSVYRVQDNYVSQWGDRTEKKPLPPGLQPTTEDYSLPAKGVAITRMPSRDAYAPVTGFWKGWPVAGDGKSAWLPHCYGMVGVGRNLSPDAGTGAELYAVIGHAPRHLDRNIALVGRVVEGMDALSALPRGTEGLGVYGPAQEPTGITSVRLASELPAADRPHFVQLDTAGPSFLRYAAARANRKDAFFNIPAGGADICNIPVPVKRSAPQ